MAAGSTYTPIATTTLASAAASYTFSSIPSTYTDLVLISSANVNTATANITVRVGNGSVDTGTNYSNTFLYGTGSAAGSSRNSTANVMYLGAAGTGSEFSTSIMSFQNYANTTTYKSILSRFQWVSTTVYSTVGMWRSTSAINTISLISDGANFNIGTTFTLYGIAAA